MDTTWLQNIHLVLVALAFGASLSSIIFSSLYVAQQWNLKQKRNNFIFAKVPSLETLDRYAIRSLIFGLVVLVFLLITGITLAHYVWEKRWLQDGKFIVAFFTMIWFLFVLLLRFRLGIRGNRFFWSVLLGFGFLVVSSILAWVM